MTRNVQAAITSAIAVTLFVLLVYPAIISLEVPPNIKSQYQLMLQYIVLALGTVAALLVTFCWRESVRLGEAVFNDALDPQALTCTRRC